MDSKQFTKNGKYLMLALDHRGSFKVGMNPKNPDSVSAEDVINLKSEIIKSLIDKASGVLVDVTMGLPALRLSRGESKIPYLLSAEKTGYEVLGSVRKTLIEFEPALLKNEGASGVKLLLYFHPDADNADEQIETASRILKASHDAGLPLFLELVSYEIPGRVRPSIVFDSVSRCLSDGVVPDVFKLEFSGDEGAARKITDLLGDTPWILLTRGVKFEEFKPQLLQSVNGGASGFLAGRALWQEALSMDLRSRDKFLSEVLPKRFDELVSIING